MAEFLVKEFPETRQVRDKRNNLPVDLVSNWTHHWEHILEDNNMIK